ncbi:ABC transporter permease [Spirillospora sp. NPDC047279]|uniref:ABC transporter permease n=1 Tax=Spirillospora sp. NPDC047279 TaxID=3155478 RepID=UPI0033DBB1F9
MKTTKAAKRGVFTALLFAATLLGACGVLLESALRAHAPVERFEAAAAVVTAPQSVSVVQKRTGSEPETQRRPLPERARVPIAAAEKLRAVPGVRAVVADVSFPVLTTSGVAVTGHGWDSAALRPYALTGGRAPQAADEVVLDTATAARARVTTGGVVGLQSSGTPRPYRVSGLVEAGGPGAAFFGPQAAAALSGRPGQADALAVLADGKVGSAALERAVPGLTVRTGAARGDAETLDVATARPDIIDMSASFSVVAVLTALVVVSGLIALSVRERAREIALLRAVGATPWQVRRDLLGGTLRLALAAGTAGGILSLGAGAAMHGAMSAKDVLPAGFGLSLSPLPALAALAITLVAAALSAFLASLRATRIRPAAALGEAAVEPASLPLWRVITGSVFLVLALSSLGASTLTSGSTAEASVGGTVLALIIATAFLAPLIARHGERLLAPALRGLSPVTGPLASHNIGAAALRLGSVITPVALAVAFAGVQLFAQSTAVAATEDQSADGTRAGQVVVSAGQGLPPGVLDAVRGAPGVRAATAVKRTTVVMSVRELGETTLLSLPAQGVSLDGLDQTLDPGVSRGRLGDLRDAGTVALSEIAAEGLRPGQAVPIRLGDGTLIRPRVVAVYERGRGFGDVLLPRSVVAAHTTTPLDDHVLVRGDADLRGALAPYAGAEAVSAGAYGAQVSETLRLQGFMSHVIVLAISGFVVIGLVTTLAVATRSRRDEFALLGLVGATRRQIMRMVRLEAAAMLGIGVATGVLITAVTLMAFAAAITGLPLPDVRLPTAVAILLLVTGPGAAAMVLSARTGHRR